VRNARLIVPKVKVFKNYCSESESMQEEMYQKWECTKKLFQKSNNARKIVPKVKVLKNYCSESESMQEKTYQKW